MVLVMEQSNWAVLVCTGVRPPGAVGGFPGAGLVLGALQGHGDALLPQILGVMERRGPGHHKALPPCASVSPAVEAKAQGSAPPAPAAAAPPLLAFRSPAGHPTGHEGQASSPIPLAVMWVSGCEPAPVPWSRAGEGAVGPKWDLNGS